jgi:hypothetical protein
MLPLEDGGVVDTKLKVQRLPLTQARNSVLSARCTTPPTFVWLIFPSSRSTLGRIPRVCNHSYLMLCAFNYDPPATAYALGELGVLLFFRLDILDLNSVLIGADIIKGHVLV